MYEKVNPAHPDKVADRIAGALVDMAYAKDNSPRIAVEVLIGHSNCHIIAETNVDLNLQQVQEAVWRIVGEYIRVDLHVVRQDINLSRNQEHGIRCGDNGIFKGVPVTDEQKELSKIARHIYEEYPSDGKYVLADGKLIICQSLSGRRLQDEYPGATVNPLGQWCGGVDVDSGATNRKLGSDMADSVTGGGLHGKDLSKADVSVNIYAWLQAQKENRPVELFCAIGDETVDGRPYSEIVEIARDYINSNGGFEKFAEWGLV